MEVATIKVRKKMICRTKHHRLMKLMSKLLKMPVSPMYQMKIFSKTMNNLMVMFRGISTQDLTLVKISLTINGVLSKIKDRNTFSKLRDMDP